MNTTNNSDLKTTINLMHNGQGYTMIEVNYLDEPINNTWATFHYLFVHLGGRQMLEYRFCLNPNGSNSLYSIQVLNKSFDEVLIEQSHRVISDGQATLTVHPW